MADMFVGHYGVSFAAQRMDRRIPLWALFIAVQFLDVLWAPLILLGIEKVRIVPGITASNPLDLYYMPFTHSLVAAAAWSALACGLYRLWRGAAGGAATLVGFAVFSHWILDFVVHRPDLPLYDNTDKVGLGLWNQPVLAFGLEAALLFGGMSLLLRERPERKTGMVIFGIIMLASPGGRVLWATSRLGFRSSNDGVADVRLVRGICRVVGTTPHRSPECFRMNRRDALRAMLVAVGSTQVSAAGPWCPRSSALARPATPTGRSIIRTAWPSDRIARLYFCDLDNQRIRRLDLSDASDDDVAGNGEKAYGGDGGPAAAASLNMPHEIQFDAAGNLYIAERDNHVVRRVDAKTGGISTLAGTGTRDSRATAGPPRERSCASLTALPSIVSAGC